MAIFWEQKCLCPRWGVKFCARLGPMVKNYNLKI
jgi:hypothetical protein